ncbi:MAG: TolC family protein [Woeseiaceae bacterium]|nr:TolC family protein [Woeseiaceae bacterium]
MLLLYGHRPVYIVLFMFMATMSWTPTVLADARIPLTIAEAEDLAVASEPGIAALLARSDAAQEEAVAAEQLPDPTLRFGLGNFPISGGSFSTEGMTQAQLGFRQTFPRSRARDLAGETMRAEGDAYLQRAEARRREILYEVRRAWLEVYFTQTAWTLVNESRPFFDDLVTITRSMYGVGRKSQHDVLRAELELSRLDDRLIDITRKRDEARAALSRWLGEDARRPLAQGLPAWNAPPSTSDLQLSVAVHPLLLASEAYVAAREAAVGKAEEDKRPGWALDVGYGYRDGFLPSGEPRSDFVSVAVTVDMPFFGSNRQDRRLSAALSERSAARDERAELQARLLSELQAEDARLSQLSRRLALYDDRILEQSKAQARAALLAYQSDTGDFADVMRSYIDELNTRLDHIRLRVDRAQSHAALASLGGFQL